MDWSGGSTVRRAAGALAAAAMIVGIVGVVVVLGDDGDNRRADEPLRVEAPTVTAGTADLVALSETFDADGARNPLPTELVDAVRGVTGVAGAEGAVRRFVEVVPGPEVRAATREDPRVLPGYDDRPASERSTIALSWDPTTDLVIVAGSPPVAPGEVVINRVLATEDGLEVGSEVAVTTGPVYATVDCSGMPQGPTGIDPQTGLPLGCRQVEPSVPRFRVVGIFELAGGDLDQIRLVALPAPVLVELSGTAGFDRIDLALVDGADAAQVQQAAAAVLPPDVVVVAASALGSGEQLRAELEIQRAYHWLLNPDFAVRQQAQEAPAGEDDGTFARFASDVHSAEMRVSRVSFLDATHAAVTYAIYYGGSPSPIVPGPQSGGAVLRDGAWRISRESLCRLANIGGVPCTSTAGEDPAALNAPLAGWDQPDVAVDAIAALTVLADPRATLEARVAAVENGEALRAAIEDGLRADAARTDVSFHVSAARLLDPDHAEILYIVYAPEAPPLEMPYPLIAMVTRIDGRWQVASQYACGLEALASNNCAAAFEVTSPPP